MGVINFSKKLAAVKTRLFREHFHAQQFFKIHFQLLSRWYE